MMFLLMPQWQRGLAQQVGDANEISFDAEWACPWFLLGQGEVKGMWAIQFPYFNEIKGSDWHGCHSAPGPRPLL